MSSSESNDKNSSQYRIRRLVSKMKAIHVKNKNVENAIRVFEYYMPYGSLYKKSDYVIQLINKGFFGRIAKLDSIVDTFSLETINILGQIVNKCMNDTDIFGEYRLKDEIELYIKFLLKLADRPGISMQTSHNFHSKAAFLITCVDKEGGVARLWDITQAQVQRGMYFNAGHTMLDWLYCVSEESNINRESVLLIFDIIKNCYQIEEKLLDTEISVGYGKSTIWLLSNLNYFYSKSDEVANNILHYMSVSGAITPWLLRGLFRTAYTTLQRVYETNDKAYLKKTHDMIRTSYSFLLSTIEVDDPWLFIQILATACPLNNEFKSPQFLDMDKPLKLLGNNSIDNKMFEWLKTINEENTKAKIIVSLFANPNTIVICLYAALTLAVSFVPYVNASVSFASECLANLDPKSYNYIQCMSLCRAISSILNDNKKYFVKKSDNIYLRIIETSPIGSLLNKE